MQKTLKSTVSLIAVVAMLMSLFTVVAFAGETSGSVFTDVSESDSFCEDVNALYEAGYMLGTGNNKFSPDLPVTRGMAVTVLYRIAGEPEVTGTADFTDFVEDEYYSDPIIWASDNGIIVGYPDGTVCADKSITSEEVNIIISRYASNIEGTSVTGTVSEMDVVPRSTFATAICKLLDCITVYSLDITDYASDWEYVEAESFELMASNYGQELSTGIYNSEGFYSLENIVYVSNPTIMDGEPLQVLNIYVPEAYMTVDENGNATVDHEGTMTVDYYDEDGETVVGTYTWTADTAPIVILNTVDQYKGSNNVNVTGSKANVFYYEYIPAGMIVVSVRSRGIQDNVIDDSGTVVGKAPSGLVDLKAVSAFLHYNDSDLAGSSERIFSQGASAGGSMAVLLGATGNAEEFKPYLEEIGAADCDDSVYGVMAYCPITNLSVADGAYEWLHYYQTSSTNFGRTTVFDDFDLALHDALIECFVEYIQDLGLDLGDDGLSGSFYEDLADEIVVALNHAITTGSYLDATPLTVDEVLANFESSETLTAYLDENGLALSDVIWYDYDNETFVLDGGFVVFDLSSTFNRQKSVPSFDGSTESNLFGANGGTEDTSSHFSPIYLAAIEKLMNSEDEDIAAEAASVYAEIADEVAAVSDIVNMMDPMYFITGESDADVSTYWRFANGTEDADLGTASAWTIYQYLLSQGGYVTEFNFVYGAPHGSSDYLTDEGGDPGHYYVANNLLTWIAQAAAGDAVSK